MFYFCMHKRILNIPLSVNESCFLWNPRQIGRSTLLGEIVSAEEVKPRLIFPMYIIMADSTNSNQVIFRILTTANVLFFMM